MTPPLAEVEAALDAGDFARALAACAALPAAMPRDRVGRTGLRVLTAQVIAAPADRRAAIAQAGLAALRSAGLGGAIEADPLALGELYLAVNQRQQAMEVFSAAYRRRPGDLRLAHRLGLIFLTRAQETPPSDTPQAAERWSRALGYLTAAAWDRGYWREWSAARGRTYAEHLDHDHLESARELLLGQLRALLTAHAKAAAKTHPATGAALRELLVESEIDQAGVGVFGQALELVDVTGSIDLPLPFAPSWYRILDGPAQARELLGSIVRQVQSVPLALRDGPPEPAADSLGEALRQCYSRLGPIRHALLQGRAESAREALDHLCPAGDGCRPGTGSEQRRLAGSPPACDPSCGQFARCNPGYALLPDSGRTLSDDAHRLAIRTSLALAGQYVAAHPPRLIAAAQEWLRARSLAAALGRGEQFHEDFLAEVMGYLEDLADQPEHSAALLQSALAVVPTDALRGRLSDRLTERGITRANDDHTEEGAQDLRGAVRLNSHSVRARHNLCLVLRTLTDRSGYRLDRAAARDAAAELVEQAGKALSLGMDGATFGALREWGEQFLAGRLGRDPLDVLDELAGYQDG